MFDVTMMYGIVCTDNDTNNNNAGKKLHTKKLSTRARESEKKVECVQLISILWRIFMSMSNRCQKNRRKHRNILVWIITLPGINVHCMRGTHIHTHTHIDSTRLHSHFLRSRRFSIANRVCWDLTNMLLLLKLSAAINNGNNGKEQKFGLS